MKRTLLIAAAFCTLPLAAHAAGTQRPMLAQSGPAQTGMAGPSTSAAHQSSVHSHATTKAMPASLSAVGENGENIYDAVMGGDWHKANSAYAVLKREAGKLPAAIPPSSRKQLGHVIAALGHDLSTKTKHGALVDANEVTYIVANLSRSYRTPAPAEASLLDYYGRNLQIWSAAHDRPKLKAAARHIQQTWQKLRPQVVSHGGQAEAKRFDQTVNEVIHAKTAGDYNRVASPFLEEVDKVEKVFGA